MRRPDCRRRARRLRLRLGARFQRSERGGPGQSQVSSQQSLRWITPQVFRALDINPADYARGRTLQPITGFRISSMGRRDVEVPFHKVVSYGIRRCEFDEYLLRRCGAEVREGVPVAGIEPSGGGWLVNGQIKARLLVGAGGHFCPVAHALANGSPNDSQNGSPNGSREDAVVAQEIEFAMSPEQASLCPVRGEAPELYFCGDLKGYGWCFRKNNLLNLGLGRLDPHALPEHVGRFLEFLRAAGKVPFTLPGRLCGHAYLLCGYSRRQLVADCAILVGDAAGLAYAPSGEGIRTAVESGILAARTIELAAGTYRREKLQAYSALLSKRFHGKPGSRRMPQALRNVAGRLLLKSESFCRRVLVDRWFLHRHEPALAATPGNRGAELIRSAA
jgi:flavin-dependent dehydrogenase